MRIIQNTDNTYTIEITTIIGARLHYCKDANKFLNPTGNDCQKYASESEAAQKLSELNSQ